MTMPVPDWSGATGDIWAERWRDTDRALAEVGAALDAAILAAAPAGPFRALDVGCGPGTTALALAAACADAQILGCDLSAALVDIAAERARQFPNLRFIAADAVDAARNHGPFDLIFSRHGVMFFTDPRVAFAALRGAATAGAALVFSCFRDWRLNPWASELAEAAAGAPVEAPGREPSGFAFADRDYVAALLEQAGWRDPRPTPLDFDYVSGEGAGAAAQALDFLSCLGPAARLLEGLDAAARGAALERMRSVIARHEHGGRIVFPAAAWLWSARAA